MIGSGGGPVAAECGPTGYNFSKGMAGQGKAGRARQGKAGQGRAWEARARASQGNLKGHRVPRLEV